MLAALLGVCLWVKSDDQPFTMKFLAKIDRNGQFARLGPYFNLPPSKGVRLSTHYMHISLTRLMAARYPSFEKGPHTVRIQVSQ